MMFFEERIRIIVFCIIYNDFLTIMLLFFNIKELILYTI